MPSFEDLTGNTYGDWFVVRRTSDHVSPKGHPEPKYTCKCTCGVERAVMGRSLKRGLSTSCGAGFHNNRGHQRLGYGEASFNALYRRYERDAKNRGYSFELDKNQFKEITSQPCHYCGIPPKQINMRGGFNGEYLYNGIDRVDNNLGYSQGNLVACCGECNRMKADKDYSVFLEHILKIVSNCKIGNVDVIGR